MNNKILKINKLFVTGVITLMAFSVPFFALALSEPIDPVAVTGSYEEINDGDDVKIRGRVTTGKDVSAQAWFEYGFTTSSLNTPTDAQNIITHGGVIDYIPDVEKDRKYFYRVVVQNSLYRSYGEIESFFIQGGGNIEAPEAPVDPDPQPYVSSPPTSSGSYVSGTYPVATTNSPGNVMVTRADLSGGVLTRGNINTNGWFEWGKTTSLGKQTLARNIGNGTSLNFSEALPGLTPNTTYYYRAVVQNQNGIDRGDIVQFKTRPTPITQNHPNNGSAVVVEKNDKEEQLASALFAGDKFLPSTLIEWLLFIILLLVIIILSFHIYGTHKKKKEYDDKKKKESETETQN